MRIADIQTAVIAANYDWTLIKIRTDDGAVGYGESMFAPGLTTLIRDFKPLWEELALGWDGPIIKEGHIHLDPTRPGLGIAFNEEEAYKFRNREEPFFDEE